VVWEDGGREAPSYPILGLEPSRPGALSTGVEYTGCTAACQSAKSATSQAVITTAPVPRKTDKTDLADDQHPVEICGDQARSELCAPPKAATG
jgi:hypothetical protein